jgi:uncharacterized protein
MPLDLRDSDPQVEPMVSCSDCAAVCCRLEVLVEPNHLVPRELLAKDDDGLVVMARLEDGWCAALDREHMQCSIYETRPRACRRFTMGGNFCHAIREDYQRRLAGTIAHLLVDSH